MATRGTGGGVVAAVPSGGGGAVPVGVPALLRAHFVPTVLVLCTPDVLDLCTRTHLPPIHALFSRYSAFNQQLRGTTCCYSTDIPVRTIGEQPYEIKSFQVKFTTMEDLEKRFSADNQHHVSHLSSVAALHAVEEGYLQAGPVRSKADCSLLAKGGTSNVLLSSDAYSGARERSHALVWALPVGIFEDPTDH